MKIVWTIFALLLVAGLVVLFQPSSTPASARAGRDAEAEIDALVDLAEQSVVADSPAGTEKKATQAPDLDQALAARAGDATKADLTKPDSAEPESTNSESTRTRSTTNDTEQTGVSQSAPSEVASGLPKPEADAAAATPAEPTTAKPGDKPQPSAEPAPPKPEAVASGAEFAPEIPKIPEAEILPSRFVKLPDGAISVDDAWTVRGAGTAEVPYEISWEYLSSAQETYTPRLGEKKIPARIAFLSGKRVRISGYLAFPLVAPTASECLVMLNQWDGCCIGIPPTPYDAIEVKLASELKGWKKHTINFGAVEGTFKVEPYLVENWLVGLYLIENAKINTEL